MKSKINLLTAAAVVAMAGSAGAATLPPFTKYVVFGGGASLPAPFIRTAGDCYGGPVSGSKAAVQVPLVAGALSGPTGAYQPFFYYQYDAVQSLDCSTTSIRTDAQILYRSRGSGEGIAAYLSHDPAKVGDWDFNTAGDQFFGTPGYQPKSSTYFHFAASDSALTQAHVDAYNNGGTIQGVSLVDQNATTVPAGWYRNPRKAYGQLIQIPALITTVNIAYDGVYKKKVIQDPAFPGDPTKKIVREYKLHVINGARASGGLLLSKVAYCSIFNGTLTNWNDSTLSTLNGGSLQDPQEAIDNGGVAPAFSVPLQIVGRADNSGTTALFTRHLAAVCGGNYADFAQSLPSALHTANATYVAANPTDPVAGETPGQFTLANGNDNVAKYVNFDRSPLPTDPIGTEIVQGRIGYVGPDWTLPAVNNFPGTVQNTYALRTASLQNNFGSYVEPSAFSANRAFGTAILPPQSNSDGTYNAAASGSRANPLDWVQSPNKTAPIAIPTDKNAYPISGTSNLLTYSCYASNRNKIALLGFLKFFYKDYAMRDSTNGILGKSGFSPVPASFRQAILDTFWAGYDPYNLHLNIELINDPDLGNHNSACTASTIIGG